MIIRCTSTGFAVARRTASTTTGPIVRFGTKRPSMTSTWIQSAPASSTAHTSSASRPQSDDRIDGATMICLPIRRLASRDRSPLAAAAPQQFFGGFRAGGAGRIEFERQAFRIVMPDIEDRLHRAPAGLDAVAALK